MSFFVTVSPRRLSFFSWDWLQPTLKGQTEPVNLPLVKKRAELSAVPSDW